jgi:single-strand DNA-binding protein
MEINQEVRTLMASVNKVILVGHVGKDPDIRATGSGDTVASFSLATNSGYGENKTTDWHNVSVFGKTADFVRDYVKKGAQLYVEGSIRNRSYNDKSGNKKYVTEIKAYTIQALGQKETSGHYVPGQEQEQEEPIPF